MAVVCCNMLSRHLGSWIYAWQQLLPEPSPRQQPLKIMGCQNQRDGLRSNNYEYLHIHASKINDGCWNKIIIHLIVYIYEISNFDRNLTPTIDFEWGWLRIWPPKSFTFYDYVNYYSAYLLIWKLVVIISLIAYDIHEYMHNSNLICALTWSVPLRGYDVVLKQNWYYNTKEINYHH